MKNQFEKSAGFALILGSIMMIITMVLHPAGDLEDYYLIIGTHSLAILSIPVSLLGFWGLTKRLNSDNIFSMAAFIIMSVGLFAVMNAAVINGLAYPLFTKGYNEVSDEIVSAILHYSFALNQAMTLVYIGASCLSILLWSVAILRNSKLPKWIGYFGILICIGAFVVLFSGYVLTDLHGFRIFIFGSVSWVLVIGYLLTRSNSGAINEES